MGELSVHFMSVSSILCRDTPCASHLLCKNNLTWQGTTLTELFLEQTFGNWFSSFKYPDKVMPVSDIWGRCPPQRLPPLTRSGVHWVMKAGAAERCFLLLCSGVAPAGTCSAFTGCQLSDFSSNWSNLASLLCCPPSLPVKEVDSFLRCPVCCVGQSFGETAVLLSALSGAKHVTGSSGKSHGFIRIDFNSVMNENCWDKREERQQQRSWLCLASVWTEVEILKPEITTDSYSSCLICI